MATSNLVKPVLPGTLLGMADCWYEEGLRFRCTGCGDCCTGAPGYVWLNAAEIAALARSLGLPLSEFGRQYLRKVGERHSLREFPNGDCIFFRKDAGCLVYSLRPRQCRTFPFWPENLRTGRAWEDLKKSCPGVDGGRLFSREEIQRIRKGRGEVQTGNGTSG